MKNMGVGFWPGCGVIRTKQRSRRPQKAPLVWRLFTRSRRPFPRPRTRAAQSGARAGDHPVRRTVRLAASSYCAFGASDGLGAGAAPVGAAFFFFFFFFFGGSLGCCASGCWASAFDAVITEAATAKLAARPARRNSFRREITSGSIGLLMVNLSALSAAKTAANIAALSSLAGSAPASGYCQHEIWRAWQFGNARPRQLGDLAAIRCVSSQ
jgi:hypothetical protein